MAIVTCLRTVSEPAKKKRTTSGSIMLYSRMDSTQRRPYLLEEEVSASRVQIVLRKQAANVRLLQSAPKQTGIVLRTKQPKEDRHTVHTESTYNEV